MCWNKGDDNSEAVEGGVPRGKREKVGLKLKRKLGTRRRSVRVVRGDAKRLTVLRTGCDRVRATREKRGEERK